MILTRDPQVIEAEWAELNKLEAKIHRTRIRAAIVNPIVTIVFLICSALCSLPLTWLDTVLNTEYHTPPHIPELLQPLVQWWADTGLSDQYGKIILYGVIVTVGVPLVLGLALKLILSIITAIAIRPRSTPLPEHYEAQVPMLEMRVNDLSAQADVRFNPIGWVLGIHVILALAATAVNCIAYHQMGLFKTVDIITMLITSLVIFAVLTALFLPVMFFGLSFIPKARSRVLQEIKEENQSRIKLLELERKAEAERRAKEFEQQQELEAQRQVQEKRQEDLQRAQDIYGQAIGGAAVNMKLMREAADLGHPDACVRMGTYLTGEWREGSYTKEEKRDLAREAVSYFSHAENMDAKATLLWLTSRARYESNTADQWKEMLKQARELKNSGELSPEFADICTALIDQLIEVIDAIADTAARQRQQAAEEAARSAGRIRKCDCKFRNGAICTYHSNADYLAKCNCTSNPGGCATALNHRGLIFYDA